MTEQTPESTQTNGRKLLGASGSVGGFTMLSRIFGLVRDVVLAQVLGAVAAADAFFVAFRIPNFFRRLFAEGAFNIAFVPVLSDYRQNRDHLAVQQLVNRTAGVLGSTLLVFTLIVVAGSPVVATIFAPGFRLDPEKFELASQMIRITFPYLLFISLTGMAGAILNAYDRFAAPAFTPVLLNVCLISGAIIGHLWFDETAVVLAWAVLVAGVLQLSFQLPFLARIHLLPWPESGWKDPGVRRILKLMAPAVIGASVYQINLLFDTLIASLLPTGSVSWLYYSDRLSELPLGVFGIAIATVILPSLSRQRFSDNPRLFSDTLDWANKVILLVGLPASVALIILALPILTTLFMYGEMRPLDVRMSAASLQAYALGLVAFMLIKVLATGYFSREDTRTPIRIGIIAMIANMAMNVVFVLIFYHFWSMGHVGLALATSLSAFLNLGLLYRGLRKTNSYQPEAGWPVFVAKLIAALLVMVLAILISSPEQQSWIDWSAWQRVGCLLGICMLGAVSYFGTLILLGMRPKDLH
jgi:putative peptidoglycan lipid II flippase